MKKGEAAELTAKWWKASQPKGLASAAKLEVALRAHETAAAEFKKDPKPDRLKHALDTLDAVKDATQKAVAEAQRAKANPEMEFTVQSLQKLDFKKEAKTLEAAAESQADDDEDADAATLKDPKEFAKALRKPLNRLADEPRNWGFLCGKKPIEHRFFLSKAKNGRTIATAAAKMLAMPAKVSFGTVTRSPDHDKTIILTVQGAMLAGLATRLKAMLAKMKPQSVDEVLLMVDGQIVSETVDPDDVDAADDDAGPGDAQIADPALEALHRRIAALEPRAAAVIAASPQYRDQLTTSITQMMAAMEKEDVAAARPLLERLEAIVARLEPAADDPRQALQRRIDALTKEVNALGAPADLIDDLASASSALRAGDVGLAGSLLDDMQTRMASLRRGRDAADEIAAAAPSRLGAVAFAKIRLQWAAARNAREEALDNLHAVCDAMLADPGAADDPQYDEMVAASAEIGGLMPDLGTDIDDAIDAMATTDATRREDARKAALAAIARFRADLDREPALKQLQDMPVGRYEIYDHLATALEGLEHALAL